MMKKYHICGDEEESVPQLLPSELSDRSFSNVDLLISLLESLTF